jgi:hypothetical protein
MAPRKSAPHSNGGVVLFSVDAMAVRAHVSRAGVGVVVEERQCEFVGGGVEVRRADFGGTIAWSCLQ